jgi:hypothetical protein
MDWEQVRFCFLQVILIASTTEGAFQFRGFPPQLSVYLNKTFTRLNETFYLAEDNETELVQQDKISDEPYVTWKANAANLDYTLSTNILDTDTLYGTRNWTLQALQQFTLNFNNCTESEFCCDDGVCVPVENRCDFIPDCADESDEVDCELFR